MKTLLNEEYDVLNKIASKTKADCWFVIEQTENGEDYVRDLEEGWDMSLRDGISVLMGCLDCKENYENCNLSKEEEKVLRKLLFKLNI